MYDVRRWLQIREMFVFKLQLNRRLHTEVQSQVSYSRLVYFKLMAQSRQCLTILRSIQLR